MPEMSLKDISGFGFFRGILLNIGIIRSPLKILHGQICGDYFRHISQNFSAIHKVFTQIFVSSDEKISRSFHRAEYLEVPISNIGSFKFPILKLNLTNSGNHTKIIVLAIKTVVPQTNQN